MLKTVNLHNAAGQIEEILSQPLNHSVSYEKFLEGLLQCEIKGREEKRFERRIVPDHNKLALKNRNKRTLK